MLAEVRVGDRRCLQSRLIGRVASWVANVSALSSRARSSRRKRPRRSAASAATESARPCDAALPSAYSVTQQCVSELLPRAPPAFEHAASSSR